MNEVFLYSIPKIKECNSQITLTFLSIGKLLILSFIPPINVSIPSKHIGGTLSVVRTADSGNDNLHRNSKKFLDKSVLSKSYNHNR